MGVVTERRRIAVDLTPEQDVQLRAIAAAEHRTLNGLFRMLVEQYLAAKKEAQDAV